MRRMQRAAACLYGAAVLLAAGAPARADLIQSGNLDMTAGGNDPLPGTGFNFTNHVWTGNGHLLNMGGYYIKNSVDTSGFTLNLAGGGITNGGNLTTSRFGNTGSITIQSAGAVAVGQIATGDGTGGDGDGAKGAIMVTNSGSFTASSLMTACRRDGTTGNQTYTGDFTGGFSATGTGTAIGAYHTGGGNEGVNAGVHIYGYAGVTVNGTINASGEGRRGGPIDIGTGAQKIAGNIVLQDITNAGGSGGNSITLYATGSVTVGAVTMGINTTDVANYVGNLTVVNQGTFSSKTILARATRDAAASILSFNGTDRSGAFTVTGDIDQYKLATGGGNTSPSLTISNYASVAVSGTLRTETTYYPGGNITISNIAGDIAIGGINAKGTTGGGVSLTAGGFITLADLNLSNVQYAVVSPGWKCIVVGDLLGFSTNVTTQTQLRMPVGKRMIYYPSLTNNAYLAGGKYALASVDGTPAAGGVLMPYASPGTVVMLK